MVENAESLLVLPLFAGGWLLMSPLLAWMASWRKLGEHYGSPPDQQSPQETFTCQSGTIGWIRYRGCLRATLHPDYLCIQPVWLFSFSHPPLHFPRALLQAGAARRQLMGGWSFRFQAAGVRVVVYGKLAHRLGQWIRSDPDAHELPRRLR